jgi:hypothetical protein
VAEASTRTEGRAAVLTGRAAQGRLRAAALLFGGLFAGFMATVLVLESSLRSFDGTVYTQVRQVELVGLDTFATATLMPALVLTALLVVVAFRGRAGHRWVPAVALALWVLVLGTTLLVNLPINADQLTWKVPMPPADWARVRDRWQGAHVLRTVAAMLAFGLLIAVPARGEAEVGRAHP